MLIMRSIAGRCYVSLEAKNHNEAKILFGSYVDLAWISTESSLKKGM